MNALAASLVQTDGCPSCGEAAYGTLFRGSDRLYATTEREFHVVECVSCGLIRLHPTPPPDELRRFYPETYWWEADASAAGRLAELYRQFVLGDHIRFALGAAKPPGPVLDVGCGGGSFLNALRKRGFRVAGADTSAQAAGICWSRHGIPAVRATLPSLPFQPGTFQMVTLFHVLEHLYDPAAALIAVREATAPGGSVIVQTPNAACWQFLLLGDRWSGLDIPRHLINFRAADLAQLLDYCGFEVRRRKYFSLRDNPAGLATSLCPWLEPVSRKVRRVRETPRVELLKNLLYLALTAAVTPFALLEAAGEAGSTIMIEAVKRGEA